MLLMCDGAGLVKSFLAGCIASCGAVALTNPFDVIRTRLELQGELARGSARIYKGAVHGALKRDAIFSRAAAWSCSKAGNPSLSCSWFLLQVHSLHGPVLLQACAAWLLMKGWGCCGVA